MAEFNGQFDGVLGASAKPDKLIIDTDPGIGNFLFFFVGVHLVLSINVGTGRNLNFFCFVLLVSCDASRSCLT